MSISQKTSWPLKISTVFIKHFCFKLYLDDIMKVNNQKSIPNLILVYCEITAWQNRHPKYPKVLMKIIWKYKLIWAINFITIFFIKMQLLVILFAIWKSLKRSLSRFSLRTRHKRGKQQKLPTPNISDYRTPGI